MSDHACELVEKVFLTRNLAHLAHFKTSSYAEHMALGSFYEDIIEIIDNFVESYQGAFGLLRSKEEKELEEEEGEKDILKTLQKDVQWMNKNRSKIAREVPALENILDEIVGVYLRTIYKLRFLS